MKFIKYGSIGILVLFIIVGCIGAMMHSKIVYPEKLPETLVETKLIHRFEKGSFLENVAFDKEGTVFVSSISPSRGSKGASVWRRTKSGTESVIVGTGNNLAINSKGLVFASAVDGVPADPDTLIARLDLLETSTFKTKFIFPKGAAINGIAFDSFDNLYAADSVRGKIWRLTPDLILSVWLEDKLLLPNSLPGIPGANGLRIFSGSIYVVNSSSGQLFKIPIKANGEHGLAELVANGAPGDGFAVDETGKIYLTTHPYNTVDTYDPSRKRVRIGDAKNKIIGPSDCAFDPTDSSSQYLYVVQDGGAFVDLIPKFVNWLFPSDRGEAGLYQLKLK